MAHASCLAAQLPRDSRCLAKVNPDMSWSDETAMLTHIEYLLRCLIWSLGGGKGERPKPIESPAERKRLAERFEQAETVMAEVARELGI